MTIGKAPVRRKQIVEVIIPFRPWIPRYPSVNRSGDENSQGSFRSAINKPVQVKTTQVAREIAVKPSVVSRKHGRESVDDDEDDEDDEILTDKKRRKSDKERNVPGKLPKSTLMPIKSGKDKHDKLPIKEASHKTDVNASRRLKGTTSLPTIIHSKPAMDTTTTVESDDDDSVSSSEEEIYVASSPNVRRIREVSDSVELARNLKRRDRRSSNECQEGGHKAKDKLANARVAAEEGPTSSSPTTAASQRVRTLSQSRGSSVATASSKRAGSHLVSSSRRLQSTSVASSRGSGATSRTGRDLARILKDGRDSDIEEVLEDLSAAQMQKLHQQIEDRLKRVHGVKPVKRKRSG